MSCRGLPQIKSGHIDGAVRLESVDIECVRLSRRPVISGLQTAINYKVEWDEELARREKFGVEAPPIPHPDDIIIDTNTGSVRINGPLTKEDKVRWDQLRDLKATIKLDIAG